MVVVGGGCEPTFVSHLVEGGLKFDGANFTSFSLRRDDLVEVGNFKNF